MALSTSRLKRSLVALAASGVLFAGLTVAPAAEAYPPGTKPRVHTNKHKYKPKQKVRVRGSRLHPGCRVVFTWKGKKFKKTRKARVGKHGQARSKVRGPKHPGKYRVYVRQIKTKKCKAERARTTFRVKQRR